MDKRKRQDVEEFLVTAYGDKNIIAVSKAFKFVLNNLKKKAPVTATEETLHLSYLYIYIYIYTHDSVLLSDE